MTEATFTPQATPVEMASLYEGTSVQVQPAPFLKRALAFAIDAGIISTGAYLIFFVGIFLVAGTAGAGIAFKQWLGPNDKVVAGVSIAFLVLLAVGVLAVLVLFDAYFIWFESRRGATPGKSFLGLKVISLKGARLTTGQCVMRELFRHIDCMLVFPGLLSVALTKRRQRLGDLVAATIVVYSRRSENKARFLYVGQDDYQMLCERLMPGDLPAEVRDRYLAFAYPEYVLRTHTSTPEALEAWEMMVREILPATEREQIDQRSLLRFFAEHCFQLKNS